MLNLLIQIFFSLILAAALGAALAWWWLRRQYEDVTESYEDLEAEASDPKPAALTLDDLKAQLSAFPKTDLSPLEKRLLALEGSVSTFNVPEPDLTPLAERLQMIEAQLAASDPDMESLRVRLDQIENVLAERTSETLDLTPLQSEITSLGQRLPDMAPVTERVELLTAAIRDKQWVDLRPLEARMARLEGAIQSIKLPETDFDPIVSELARLEEGLSALSAPDVDLGSIHSGLARLELLLDEAKPSETDITPIQGQIDHVLMELSQVQQKLDGLAAAPDNSMSQDMAVLKDRLSSLDMIDLAPVRDRLSMIERIVGNLQVPSAEIDLRPVLAQVDRLEAAMSGFDRREIDLEPLYRQLELIKSQLMAPSQSFDMLNGRLTGMGETLAGLETAVLSMRAQMTSNPSMDSLERRFSGLQEAFLGLRQTDLSPVLSQVRAMESRMDLGAVEDRLTAIEYSLAAVHQMLRSRDDLPAATPYRAGGRYEERASSIAQTEQATWTTKAVPAPSPPPPPPPPKAKSLPKSKASDPIDIERRPDDKANLLLRPAFGMPDDLELISGVGPKLRTMLHDIGVYYFWQVAEWTTEEVDWVDSLLEHFNGRIERENWVSQAEMLAAQPTSIKRPKRS